MKRFFSLALAVLLAAGMGVAGFAAAGSGKITGFASGKGLKDGYEAASSDSVSGNAADLGEVYAGDKVERQIALRKDMFEGTDGSANLISSSDIRAAGIKLTVNTRTGSKAIAGISLNNSRGRIDIKLVEEFVSTGTLDFEATMYLTIDGKRADGDESFTVYGTLTNEEIPVYSDYDYVELGGGRVAVAEDAVNKIELDLGSGVSVFTRLTKGKKYYASASLEPTAADDDKLSKHPDIDVVVTLKTAGLSVSGDNVKLALGGDYYVYDENLTYLGRSREMMPYSTKYYLANKQLNVSDTSDAGEEPLEEEPWEEEPTSDGSLDEPTSAAGGDGGAAEGGGRQNAAPDTGDSTYLFPAVLAALAALAALAVARPSRN